ncbi:MAG: hypothetical protein ACLTQR_03620 [Methanobrevibacter smithii]
MPYKSFESLLSKFPYFLNKNWDSNFSKSERVFNSEFKKVYNNLYDVYLASKLRKHVLIWKEQNSGYNYDMYFAVSFPNLKSVCITEHYMELVSQEVVLDDGSIKINESMQEISKDIYTETFNYDDFVNHFEYLHSNTSQTIIPTEKYTITIETWDEYTTTKGFPENPIIVGDEYDHDYSLDAFGEYFRCPRRTYNEVKTSQYPDTIPAYDNQVTEDDYHYMQRLLYYATHLNDTPLPVLEIFKLFSITDAQLLNRSRLICRMTDTSKHMENGVYNRGWIPQRWEHKDGWCGGLSDDLFLFANVNNNNLLEGQKFNFTFKILNSKGEEVYNNNSYNTISETIIEESEKPYIIVPYKNNKLFKEGLFLNSNETWSLKTEDINNTDSAFIFKCFKTIEDAQKDTTPDLIIHENDLASEEIYITVKGCNSADWYVDAENGNDTNNGNSKTTAFKTLKQALSHVEGEKNIISLLNGTYNLTPENITENTTITSCPEYNPIITCSDPTFFRVYQNASLTLKNIRLNYKCCDLYSKFTVFRNENNVNYPLNVKVNSKFCLISTSIVLNKPSETEWEAFTDYILTGELMSTENVNGETVKLLRNNTVVDETTVDTSGAFSFNINTGANTGDVEYQVIHEKSNKFCNSISEPLLMNIKKITPELILPSNIYGSANEEFEIPFMVKTKTGFNGSLLAVVKENNTPVDEMELHFSNGVCEASFMYSSTSTGVKELTIIVEGNEYINTVQGNIQVTIGNITRELVDNATTFTNSFEFLDTLPSDLTQYKTDDVIITADNTGENTIHITDTEEEAPANLTENDEVWINSITDVTQVIRDKKQGE